MVSQETAKEWVTIHVTCKHTDHAIAHTLMNDMALLLRKHGVHNHEFGYFWGDEPTTINSLKPAPKKAKYRAIEEAGKLASRQLATLRRAVASKKGAK